jgi:ABC-type dipeptide/oligopeptide/nickel transport system permease subunit
LAAIAWLALAIGRELGARGRVFLAIACLPLLLLVVFPVRPPVTAVYDHYRLLEARGKLEAVIWAPVRFSPNDFERQQRLQPPSAQHILGTEINGGDVFSWMIHAARIALAIGFISTGISVTIGVAVGGLMGYFLGTIDILGMRLIEIVESIPPLILLLTFCAYFERNLYLMMAIIGLVTWTVDARFIRAEFLRLRQQDFVQAAIASGLPRRHYAGVGQCALRDRQRNSVRKHAELFGTGAGGSAELGAVVEPGADRRRRIGLVDRHDAGAGDIPDGFLLQSDR